MSRPRLFNFLEPEKVDTQVLVVSPGNYSYDDIKFILETSRQISYWYRSELVHVN